MYCAVLKVWINQGDIILIGLRDYQDAKADVILKYTPDEARNLKTYGEFPETGRGLGISVRFWCSNCVVFRSERCNSSEFAVWIEESFGFQLLIADSINVLEVACKIGYTTGR